MDKVEALRRMYSLVDSVNVMKPFKGRTDLLCLKV